MAVEDLWFGNRQLFTLVTAPESLTVARRGFVESIGYENGGGGIARSSAYQQQVSLTYPWVDAGQTSSPDVFADFAAGEYGTHNVHLANPAAYDVNVVPRHWASPALCESSLWPNISTGTPSWADTAANSYNQPARKGTWTITTAANATPLTDTTIPFLLIPIHPSRTLYIGVTGVATGTAVVRVESWVNGAAAAGATADLTLLSETGSTRMNATIAGATYAYAKVFLTRTSSATSTVTPISMMAQQTTTAPALTGVHQRGKGIMGMKFDDPNPSETFTDLSGTRHYKALAVSMTEVASWSLS